MAVTSNLFASAIDQAFLGNVKWTTDLIKVSLLAASVTPLLNSWVHYSDVSGEVTGTGYTAGGASVSALSASVTAASAWAVTWAASTPYTVGQIVAPTAASVGRVFRCVNANTSASVQPTWPTVVGDPVTDGGSAGSPQWYCAGESVTVYTSANAAWTSSTISAGYAVLYDAQSGTTSTEPLIALINFGTTVSSSSGTFTVAPDPNVGWWSTTPA